MTGPVLQGPRPIPLGPLLALTAMFFLNFVGRVIFAPLLPAIVDDLGIAPAQAGGLFLFVSAGYCAGLLGSGLISSRLDHRRTVVASAACTGAALVAISVAEDLNGIRAGLLALGAGAGLYLPSGIATLSSLVAPTVRGRALAVHEMAPNLAFVAAPLLAEAFLARFPWQAAPGLLGAASLLAALAFLGRGRGGEFRGEVPSPRTLGLLIRSRSFWLLVALFTLGIGGSLGVYAVLPLYLVTERGMEREWVNVLVAVSRLSGLVAAFGAGWAADRLGPRRALQGVFLATGAFTVLLGVLPGAWVAGAVLLQPLVAVCFFPPAFAALSQLGTPEVRNVAVSLTVPLAFLLGGGAVPAAISWFGELASFAHGVTVFGALALGASLLPGLLTPSEGERFT
ncbi:MAG: MFS transporter [Deferrisomatales bacterium]|nr:MFS transporter [Deferrisomatales bacterium]